jgi:hypothetical protein
MLEKLRPRPIISSNTIIITDILGNRVKITINYLITAKKIDIIIKKIRKNSRNSLLFEEFYNTIIKIKTDYTFIYKTCDDIINIARRRRRTAKSKKDCKEIKYLTVTKIKIIEKKSAAADEIKRKKKERY